MPHPEDQAGREAFRQIDDLFDALDLSEAVQTEEFRLFLDHVPFAIAVSKFVRGDQRIVYVNKAYEALTGQTCAQVRGQGWSVLDAFGQEDPPHLAFSEVLPVQDDFVGTFTREQPKFTIVEAFSGVIENDDASRTYRIVALIDATERERAQREELARQLRDKDVLLKELQHRVKNNLQLLTALIRLDARNQRRGAAVDLDKLAGRVETLQLLYHDLTAEGLGEAVDLGHYISEIASAVMHAYAVEGFRLDMKVDHAPASINIAMPVGLIVNELMTNAFKHAFAGRETGTITVRCVLEDDDRFRVVVADDGIGLPPGFTWPVKGKLAALVIQMLRENAQADFALESGRDKGTRATIAFTHRLAAKKPN